jgi:homogentisate 1,2-dioxygenase
LRKRHYQSLKLPRETRSPVDARVPLLYNDDVVLATLKPSGADPVYFANGDGDDLYYVHEGAGLLRSLLGDLRFAAGDYVYVPRGLVHRFVLDDVPQYWLSIEALGGLGLPKQWRNEVGQLRMDAPYCHRDFRTPQFVGPLDEGLHTVLVKRGGAFHAFAHAGSPLDVVGWDGSVYPWAFAILDFQPRVGLVHLPPTWHGTFAARGALVCSFVPRPVDFHPEAIPCPYPHASVDCDEFIFYCRGNFTSRKGVGPGSISHHPAGIPHGPHPGSYERSIGSTHTDELAVMLDTFAPLRPTAAALAVEDAEYHASFI